jgi:CheY-like chemotaxis protein
MATQSTSKRTATTWTDDKGAPHQRRSPQTAPRGATPPISGRHVPLSRRALRVLVVVDGEHRVEALARLIRGWGHDAHTVANCPAAPRRAAITAPDVVLLDVDLSLADLDQLARRFRRELARPNSLIVAITGRTAGASRASAGAADIDVTLPRSVDPAVVETLLLLECTRVNRESIDERRAPRSNFVL